MHVHLLPFRDERKNQLQPLSAYIGKKEPVLDNPEIILTQVNKVIANDVTKPQI